MRKTLKQRITDIEIQSEQPRYKLPMLNSTIKELYETLDTISTNEYYINQLKECDLRCRDYLKLYYTEETITEIIEKNTIYEIFNIIYNNYTNANKRNINNNFEEEKKAFDTIYYLIIVPFLYYP